MVDRMQIQSAVERSPTEIPKVLRETRDTINSSQYLPCDMKIAYDVPERSL